MISIRRFPPLSRTSALRLQSSFTATATSSLTLTGNLDDHHGQGGNPRLGYKPHADFFRDTLFGSFAFRDKIAPSGLQ